MNCRLASTQRCQHQIPCSGTNAGAGTKKNGIETRIGNQSRKSRNIAPPAHHCGRQLGCVFSQRADGRGDGDKAGSDSKRSYTLDSGYHSLDTLVQIEAAQGSVLGRYRDPIG